MDLPLEVLDLIADFSIDFRIALRKPRPLRLSDIHRQCIDKALGFRCWVVNPVGFYKLVVRSGHGGMSTFVVQMVPDVMTRKEWDLYNCIYRRTAAWRNPKPYLYRCWWSGRTRRWVDGALANYTDGYRSYHFGHDESKTSWSSIRATIKAYLRQAEASRFFCSFNFGTIS